jgi:bifunctional NMN adenylyltransferase/nudix hydrolase
MSKPYDYLVFIGRFQIVHNAHIKVIQEALKYAERVIVIVGSAEQPRSPKNPFTVTERWHMIQTSLAEQLEQPDLNRVTYAHSYDYSYNDQMWVEEIQETVKRLIPQTNAKVGLIGHKKDASSYYLDLFPQWGYEEVSFNLDLNASDFRKRYFEGDYSYKTDEALPKAVRDFLCEFRNTEHFEHLKKEHKMLEDYKKSWENSPFPPIFVTTDAVVVQSGHVLLIKRRVAPGKGNYALPGGFIGENERIEDSMLRELKEETRIKVPKPVLKGSIVDQKVFDNPERSGRGRTITHAYLINLAPKIDGLYKVRGGDDAHKAFWVPLSEIDSIRDKLYEDHVHIIKYFISRI